LVGWGGRCEGGGGPGQGAAGAEREEGGDGDAAGALDHLPVDRLRPTKSGAPVVQVEQRHLFRDPGRVGERQRVVFVRDEFPGAPVADELAWDAELEGELVVAGELKALPRQVE
jgi:hypothetical protein